MGSILLNNVRVGTGSIIAAGTLLAEGTKVAPGSLFMGHPGKLRRTLTPEELAGIDAYAARYVEYAQTFREEASRAEVAK
jgi:carbonic anhydrase/acetyltransferase-like protein (isoleucine patch superfamily)